MKKEVKNLLTYLEEKGIEVGEMPARVLISFLDPSSCKLVDELKAEGYIKSVSKAELSGYHILDAILLFLKEQPSNETLCKMRSAVVPFASKILDDIRQK